MNKLRAVLLLVFGLACVPALADELVGILMLEITGLKNSQGNVFVAVYDSESTWLGDEPVMNRQLVIGDALEGDLVRTELQLPPGDYALSLFHDVDGDGKMKTNFIGMPKEPIAVSNNAVGKFGPPAFEDAVFTLGIEPIVQRVDMREM